MHQKRHGNLGQVLWTEHNRHHCRCQSGASHSYVSCWPPATHQVGVVSEIEHLQRVGDEVDGVWQRHQSV